jgi:hypothetical protein
LFFSKAFVKQQRWGEEFWQFSCLFHHPSHELLIINFLFAHPLTFYSKTQVWSYLSGERSSWS